MLKLQDDTTVLKDPERFAVVPPTDGFKNYLTLQNDFQWNNDTATHPYTSSEFKTAGNLADQLSYVTTPTPPYTQTYAAQFDVRPLDTSGSGDRLELVNLQSGEGVYAESWTWMTFYVPSGYTMPSGWFIIKQWHTDTAKYQQAAAKFHIMSDGLFDFVLTPGPFANPAQALAPIESNNIRYQDLFAVTTNVWHEVVFGIGWSPVGKGFVQMFHRIYPSTDWGSPVINATDIYTVPTIVGDPVPGTIYDKIGIYRNTQSITNTIYIARHYKASSLSDLMLGATPQTKRKSIGFYGDYNAVIRLSEPQNSTIGSDWVIQGTATVNFEPAHALLGPCLVVVSNGGGGTDGIRSHSTNVPITLSAGEKAYAECEVVGPIGQRLRLWGVDSASGNIGQTAITCDGTIQQIKVLLTGTGNNPCEIRCTRTAAGSTFTYYVRGIQVNKGARTYRPRIPTTGSLVNEPQVTPRIPKLAVTPTQGCMAVVLEPSWYYKLGGATNAYLFHAEDDATHFIECYFDVATFQWKLKRQNGGSSNTVAIEVAHGEYQRTRLALAWTSTQLKISGNREPAITQADTNVFANLDSLIEVGNDLDAEVYWLALGNGTWVDADLATIFATDRVPPSTEQFPTNFGIQYVLADGGAIDSSAEYTATFEERAVA